MREVQYDEILVWSALYSRTFERGGTLRDADVRRWQRAASGEEVRHFFFTYGAAPVGVCQLCYSDQIAGLYSVGFTPDLGKNSILRQAAILIGRTVAARGLNVIYFERTRAASTRSVPAITERSGDKRLLRQYSSWVPRHCPVGSID